MHFVDTHCHIHEAVDHFPLRTETRKKYEKAGSPQPDDILSEAIAAGVSCMICVGTTVEDSEVATDFVATRDHVWASIGIHPHEARQYLHDRPMLYKFALLAQRPKVVAVGECGLDFYYGHSSPEDQKQMLRFQMEVAQENDLPMIFHVRDAFDDFWPIFDEYHAKKSIRGVVHSFSADEATLAQVLKRDLHVGLNGIMTFTKDPQQLAAARAVPLEKLVLETDAPFLTPTPYRGTICQPKHVAVTAEFLAALRGESLETLASRTSSTAQKLFGLR